MSLKTKILGLFKYDPDKDGASTFNIKQALNDNWDKLDNEVAARVKTTELAEKVKQTVKDGSLTAADLGAEKASEVSTHNTAENAHSALFQAVNSAAAAAKSAADTVQTNLNTHTANKNNPHNVTADQVGAAAKDLSNVQFGLAFEEASLPISTPCSVCYGNGKFVAVAYDSNNAAYSTDGITWTVATLPISTTCSVCYGNGKFVAVADGSNNAAYSTDGITWTVATLPSSAITWCSVCYGNGKFVAVAYGSNKAAYSTDGITWTVATLPSSARWHSVCYGNGKFVAVATSSNKAAYSTDGITWTVATLPSSATWYSVCYGNGKFVAVARDSNKAAYADTSLSIVEQLCGAGMVRVQRISYVGTGVTGTNFPTVLTFDFEPKVIFFATGVGTRFMPIVREKTSDTLFWNNSSYTQFTWEGNTLKLQGRDAYFQMNSKNTEYIAYAFG